jgi:hypothetical protein
VSFAGDSPNGVRVIPESGHSLSTDLSPSPVDKSALRLRGASLGFGGSDSRDSPHRSLRTFGEIPLSLMPPKKPRLDDVPRAPLYKCRLFCAIPETRNGSGDVSWETQ